MASLPKLLKRGKKDSSADSKSNTPNATPFGAALSDFTWRLYLQISDQSSNIFVSPLSISIALAMTYAGSNGQTKEQLKKVIFGDLYQEDDNDIHTLFHQIMALFNVEDSLYTLNVANRVYAHQNFTKDILPKYTEILKGKYASEIQPVDFNQEPKAREMINSWVKEKTKDKIQDIIAPGCLSDLTRLVLVNAIYFKGDWKKKFDPNYTGKEDFYVEMDKKVKVDIMSISNSDFYYTATRQYQILGMAYKGDQLRMYILLPTKRCGLKELEKTLTGETLLESFLSANWPRDLDCVAIPKFKLEETVNLSQTLNQMGITDMFDKSNADFSNINGQKNLYVSDVVHKAFIEVNEEGTEAAASTACMMMLCSGPMNPSFVANHPFLFAIVDMESTSILFWGRYAGSADAKVEEYTAL